MAIVLEGIKGVKSMADICREHKIGEIQFNRWRDKFFEGGEKALNKLDVLVKIKSYIS